MPTIDFLTFPETGTGTTPSKFCAVNNIVDIAGTTTIFADSSYWGSILAVANVQFGSGQQECIFATRRMWMLLYLQFLPPGIPKN